jgi:MoxR-like ATPase
LIAAAAASSGRKAPTSADRWPLVFALPSEGDQDRGRAILRELLADSESSTLVSAPLEGRRGLGAHAARLVREGQAVLEAGPKSDDVDGGWELRLEGLAREIDALFPRSATPEGVAELRGRIVEILGTGARTPTVPPERSGLPS